MMINTAIMWRICVERGVDAVGKKRTALALTLAVLLTLSGCLFRSPDDLYRQPEKSPGYEQLNAAIRAARTGLETEFGTRVEDVTIMAGDNTASIQLQDLDGDGLRESAVTFFRVPGIEKPIKIYIFTQIGEEYVPTGVVEGEGSAIYAIAYAQINGEGRKELAVNWQINSGAYQLGVYTLDEVELPGEGMDGEESLAAVRAMTRTDLMGSERLLTRCSVASDGSSGCRLLDMDQDTRIEILVTRMDAVGPSQVELYSWEDGAIASLGGTELSAGINAINRIRTNYLAGDYNQPALYVTSTLADNSKVIDVVSDVGGALTNVALSILMDKSYETQDYRLHYSGVSAGGKKLRSCTMFIKQNGRLIGMLCINFDDSRYQALSNQILQLCHPDLFAQRLFRPEEDSPPPQSPPHRPETFRNSTEAVALDAIHHELERLGVSNSRELCYYALCVVREPVADSTVNLRCPIVVNDRTRQAVQTILDTPEYGMRHPLSELHSQKEEAPC